MVVAVSWALPGRTGRRRAADRRWRRGMSVVNLPVAAASPRPAVRAPPGGRSRSRATTRRGPWTIRTTRAATSAGIDPGTGPRPRSVCRPATFPPSSRSPRIKLSVRRSRNSWPVLAPSTALDRVGAPAALPRARPTGARFAQTIRISQRRRGRDAGERPVARPDQAGSSDCTTQRSRE